MFSEAPRLVPVTRRPSAPPAQPAPVWFGAYGGKTSIFIDATDRAAWTAVLSASAAGWLHLDGPAAGTGPGLVTLSTEKSTVGEQTATLTVQVADAPKPLAWPVRQISSAPLSTLNASVLQVPFPTVPNVMELGIAGKYVAQQIVKVPEPFTPLVLAIVELIVPLLGELLIALRQALSEAVPEPKTWFGAPQPYDALTTALPATAVFITEEYTLLDLYIAEQVAENG